MSAATVPSRSSCRGISVVEVMVSLTVLLLITSGLASLMIQNSRLNKSQQMVAAVQSNARNCLEMVVQKLRSAGWDPMNAGIQTVALDPDTTDDVSQIEIFADLNEDGDSGDADEQILIRHVDNRIEWRTDAAAAFEVLATNVSNDADGDGTIEPMFTPDANPPSSIVVQITARAPLPDPVSGQVFRYTVRSEVLLRKAL